MTRRYWGAMLLIMLALLASGCSAASSLTQQQLQEFIRQRNIQPVAIEDVGGTVTVILYKNANEVGCYVAFARNGIEALHLRSFLVNLKGDAIDPISFDYKPVTRYDIVCLTINDVNIQASAHTLKVVFPDKREVSIPVGNNGNMIVYQEFVGRSEEISEDITIIVYDNQQKEIFRTPSW